MFYALQSSALKPDYFYQIADIADTSSDVDLRLLFETRSMVFHKTDLQARSFFDNFLFSLSFFRLITKTILLINTFAVLVLLCALRHKNFGY